MSRVRAGVQRWSVTGVVVAVVVLVLFSGCRDQVFEATIEENESEQETYTLTFDKQGGVGGSTSVTVTLGQPMPVGLPPTKGGAVFDGYYARLYTAPGGTGAQYYTAEMESARDWDTQSDVELVAHWTYQIGDDGPAGGIVFYDKGEYTEGWRYLEAWTADEVPKPWKIGGSQSFTGGTSTNVGSGYDNTYSALIGVDYAAAQGTRLRQHGGHHDWFLPSRDELELMYHNLAEQGSGGFEEERYWSSSERTSTTAWTVDFDDGFRGFYNKGSNAKVRAARAF